MAAPPDELDSRIRITHGGPFYTLMSGLGLRQQGWRALVFGSLCWGIPLLIALTTADGRDVESFLRDWGAWAKFLLAPILFTLAERPIGFAIDECTSVFFRTPLIASQSMDDAFRALRQAKAGTIAWLPETTCLVLAITASLLNFQRFQIGFAPAWASLGESLTGAGVWCVVVSNTLYWFLLSRLVWKHMLWARFLRRIAACRLRLAVTHPDGHGGLGILGLYPAGYALFSLGISSVTAAGIGHVMQRQTVTPALFSVVCAGWLLIALLYYALPLAGLVGNIGRLKRKGLVLSMTRATDFERRTERSLLGENILPDEAEPDSEEFRDVKPLYHASLKTSALLLNKDNLLPVLVPALLPLLVVGASYLSYSQLGPIVKRLLFL